MAISLACAIAISTVGALMLPAIAMEKECGLQEHQHTQACYEWISATGSEEKPVAEPILSDAEEPQQMEARLETEGQTEPQEVGEWKLVCERPEHIHTEACERKAEEALHGPEVAAEAVEPLPESSVEPSAPSQSTDTTQAELPAVPDAERPSEIAEHVDDTEDDDFTGTKTPIDLGDAKARYIHKLTLKYRAQTGIGSWQEMQPGVPIPGDSKLRLEVQYKNVRIEELLDHSRQLQFAMPDFMRDPEAQGEIKSGDEVVGTTAVAGNLLTLTFDEAWLRQLQAQVDVLRGDFYVESTVKLSAIPGDGTSLDIVYGDVHLNPTFDMDAVARYGTLTIEKKVSEHVIETDGEHYLDYTVKVTAGEYGNPAVRVVDSFTSHGEYAEYIGITTAPKTLTTTGFPREEIGEGQSHGQIYQGSRPTEQVPIPPENDPNIQAPGSLIWNIGNMDANEVRILTYRVHMKDSQAQHTSHQSLRNQAEAFSKEYKKAHATADFIPKMDMGMKKSHSAPQKLDNGDYKITYTVWFETPNSNNHVVDQVRVTDRLEGTDPKILPYVHYAEDSFRLYGSKVPQGTPISCNPEGGGLPTLVYDADGKGFALTVGDMEPGRAYSFQYDVIVESKVFGANQLKGLTVQNRAIIYADNATLPTEDFLQAYTDRCNLGYQNWIQKKVDGPLSEAVVVPLPADALVYEYDADGSVVLERGHPEQFEVPAGSFYYTVELNQLGDWDVTQATIKDILNKQYLQYSGYLRVDAYDAKQTAEDALGTKVDTRWLDVDGRNSFEFQLSALGLDGNSYAYRLTYYAAPANHGGIIQSSVRNEVHLSGPVLRENERFEVDFSSGVEVTVHGGHSFQAMKRPWFYERSQRSSGDWSKGAIYWVVEATGTQLHEGTLIRDHVKNEYTHHERGRIVFHDDSFVGVYRGRIPDGKTVTDYGDLQELLDSGLVTEMPKDEYCDVTYENHLNFQQPNSFSRVDIRMKKPVEMGENSVFFVLRAEPDRLPTGSRTQMLYTNYLDFGDDANNLIGGGSATKVLYGGQNIMKEFSSYFKYDGKEIEVINRKAFVPKEHLPEPGHYIAWGVKVNYGGDLAGRYRVIDEIPEGVDLGFMRLQWLGEKTRNHNVSMPRIEHYAEELGEGWTEHEITAEMDANLGPATGYYYTNGKQILWEVDNLQAGHEKDAYAVDFQVVCRVTDPEVLLGGAEKEFVNQVTLHHNGKQIDRGSNGVRVTAGNIRKSAVFPDGGSSIPYTIRVNDTGEDLVAGSDAITLVDEMSSTLSVDVESVKVVNSRDQSPVDVRVGLDGQQLTVTMPDNQPLTITYTAHVHAVPGTNVALSNRAYWLGYAPSGGSNVEKNDFYYKIGGNAGGAETPEVKILKFNKNNILEHLPGAEFRMEEGEIVNGQFQGNGMVWTGTTESNGELIFGAGKKHMRYNTVYRVTETRAPEGYLLDPTPYDFIMAEKNADGQYPEYPEGIHVHYASATHTIKAPNSKGEAYVQKEFRNLGGQPIRPIPGQYRFGLFDNPDGTGEPLQEVTLIYRAEDGDQPLQKGAFVDLDLDKTYYVFELDQDRKPILPGHKGYVNQIPFRVEYRSEVSAAVQGVQNGTTVTVTNQLGMEGMPETGGMGTTPFALLGTGLMSVALLGAGLRRRDKKRNKTSMY